MPHHITHRRTRTSSGSNNSRSFRGVVKTLGKVLTNPSVKKGIRNATNRVIKKIHKNFHYKVHRKPKTKTEKGYQFGQMISQHNDMSFTNVACTHKPSKDKLKTLGKFKYENLKQYVPSQNSTGTQLVTIAPHVFTKSQMVGDTSSTVTDFNRWSDDPFLFNYNSTVPANAVYNNTPFPSIVDADKIAINKLQYDLQLVNLKSISAEIQVYWFLCKRATNNAPWETWSEAVENEEGNLQTSATHRTTFGTTTVTAGRKTRDVYGTDPMNYKLFKSFWKPIGSHNVILQPGDVHNMRWNCVMNKVYTRKFLKEQTSQFVAGLSICPMIIGRGQIVGLSTDGSTAAQEVSYSPVHIGMVGNVKIQFAQVPANRITQSRVYEGQIVGGSYVGRQINDTDDAGAVQDA